MKVMLFNGSPRKDWNTALLLEAAARGARDAGAETELVRLGDLTFTGCRSCFACKRKGNRTNGVCAVNDGLREILLRTMEADAVIVGAPVYFDWLSGITQCFLERLLFPVTHYETGPDGKRLRTLPKEKRCRLIVTMNLGEEAMKARGYDVKFGGVADRLGTVLGDRPAELLYAFDTLQFDDYGRYEVNTFDPVKKAARRREVFPEDLEKAYRMGQKLTLRS